MFYFGRLYYCRECLGKIQYAFISRGLVGGLGFTTRLYTILLHVKSCVFPLSSVYVFCMIL
jgi:hypothetical protein